MASDALIEFSKKPASYKIAVFLGLGVALGALYFQFGYKKTRAELDDAEAKNQSLRQTKRALENDKKEYEALLKESDELQRQLEENAKALPTEAELPAFFETLSRKVGEAGVEVRKWDYGKETAVDGFLKVPVVIEITGTWYQIKRFFASLVQRDVNPGSTTAAERERIITIENLELTEPKERNREIVLAAKFSASTFRLEPKAAPPGAAPTPAPAAAPPAGAGAKAPGAGSGSAGPGSGSGTGSGAGSARPAPAATPAGAKAATTKALETSEQRVAPKGGN
ncbi:MAG: type 4a pilus biogenesis protein PilO [Kofleriaceae bacterium]|jgi:Tfp pilus assembly protein PilO|nr:type 4a pilus biogenesis protein PilO [Kofleriaceae bacterium]MBP6839909.1 type 4a pilus biogenesis protein PilO [Kofleriaceae bacterium]MBP9206503.1 type 4a pilus biogenesis protein PilO [Kofleriaceae bacterium]